MDIDRHNQNKSDLIRTPTLADFKASFKETADGFEQVAQEDRKRDEEQLRRWRAKFAQMKFGKIVFAAQAKLKKNVFGRAFLVLLKVSALIAVLAIPLSIGPISDFVSDTFVNPPAYRLTNEELAQGYTRTCDGNKTCWQEDVAYRFYTDAEMENDANCSTKYDWCIYAIPLYKDCKRIFVDFNTSESDAAFAEYTDAFQKKFSPSVSKYFKPGERISFGINSKKPDAKFGSVTHIFCETPS